MYVHLFLFTSSIQTCWYWSGSLFYLVDTLVGGDSCPYFRGSMTLVQAQWNFLQRIDTRYFVLVPYQWIMQLYTARKTELKVQVPQALLLWRKEPIFWLRPQSLVFPSWTVSVGHSPSPPAGLLSEELLPVCILWEPTGWTIGCFTPAQGWLARVVMILVQ